MSKHPHPRTPSPGRRSPAPAHRFALESLEPRTLLSAVLTQPIADVSLGSNPPATLVNLNNHFNDTTVSGTVVKFDTSMGDFFVELYANQAPTTVANFLGYVNGGSYAETFFHRSNTNFSIIQGGSFTVEGVSGGISIDDVVTGPSIPMEFVVPNVRGTIAMARSSAQDSATSGFFFNTADNTDIWTAQNPYAAFGGVLYDGMTVVDAIQALQVFPFGSPFDEVPLTNYTVNDFNSSKPVNIENVIVVNSVQVVGELVYTVTSNSNPGLVTPTINSAGQLTLTYGGQGGVANVTIRGTDHGGNFIEDTFQITVSAGAGAEAVDDTASTRVNTPVVVPVLGNDSGGNGTLVASSVAIAIGPAHGQVSVNATTGAITYTPADGYFGADSFTYTVDNSLGDTAGPATVNISVNNPPTANDDTATAGGTLPVIVDVLGNDTDADGTLNAASVAVASNPGNGSVSVNPATGAITYTADSGFVGTDTFTYTVADNLGDTSAAATVTVTVTPFAVTVGDGGAKSVSFTDADGTLVTIKLKTGSAMLHLEGENMSRTVNRGKVTISGDNLQLVGIDLQNTTAASTLTINAKGGADGLVEVGDITGDGALKALSGSAVHLTGNLSLAEGLASLKLGRMTGSTITLGGSPTGATLALNVGDVVDASLSTANGIKSLVAGSWVDGDSLDDTVAGPWMNKATFKGDVSADITLTGEGAVKNTLGATRVTGAILGGMWDITGHTAALRSGAAAAGWSLEATGDVAGLTFDNDASGSVTANSIKKLVGTASLRNMTLTLLQDVDPANPKTLALGNLNVKQWLDNVELRSDGSLGNLKAGGARNSTFFAGVNDNVVGLPSSVNDFAAMAHINSIKVTGVPGELYWAINSNMAAWSIGTVAFGFAQFDNGGEPFGLAGTSVRSITYRDTGFKVKMTTPEEYANFPVGDMVARLIDTAG